MLTDEIDISSTLLQIRRGEILRHLAQNDGWVEIVLVETATQTILRKELILTPLGGILLPAEGDLVLWVKLIRAAASISAKHIRVRQQIRILSVLVNLTGKRPKMAMKRKVCERRVRTGEVERHLLKGVVSKTLIVILLWIYWTRSRVEGLDWVGIPVKTVSHIDSKDKPVSSDLRIEEITEETEKPAVELPNEEPGDSDNPLVVGGSGYLFTDVKDLEEDWEEFDARWEFETKNQKQDVEGEKLWMSLSKDHTLRSLVWPISLVVGGILLSGIVILATCWTRRQIYCCGSPCFDSSHNAASNYDRSALRKEKLRMIKQNTLSHAQFGVDGECIRNDHAGRFPKRMKLCTSQGPNSEEFMEEYNRRFPMASFQPIHPLGISGHTVPKVQPRPEIIVVKVPVQKILPDGPTHVYDKVHDVNVQEV